MTELMDRTAQEEAPRVAEGRNRFLRTLVAWLVVAVVGLSSWIVYEQTTESGTSLDSGIEQLLDDYLGAWEARDQIAIQAAVSEGYLLNEYIYEVDADGVTLAETIVNNDVDDVMAFGFLFEWQVEHVGDAVVTGDSPWFVSLEENWILPHGLGLEHYDGIASYTIVDEGGSLRIANHSWAGLRYDTTE